MEKQLDIYLCLMKREPPGSEFAYDIADRGEEAIPYVIARLKKVDGETEKRDLIYLLEVMSDRDYLRGKKDILNQVKEVICSMKISTIREQSLEDLKRIQINSGPYSPLMSQCPE